MSKKKEEFGKWIEEWCWDTYYRDYDYCIGLSFRVKQVDIKKVKSEVERLFKILDKEIVIDGIYVIEDKYDSGLHVHGLIVSNVDEDKLGKLFHNHWYKRNGIYWMDEFKLGMGYDYYMSKDYDKRMFDFGLLNEFLY